VIEHNEKSLSCGEFGQSVNAALCSVNSPEGMQLVFCTTYTVIRQSCLYFCCLLEVASRLPLSNELLVIMPAYMASIPLHGGGKSSFILPLLSPDLLLHSFPLSLSFPISLSLPLHLPLLLWLGVLKLPQRIRGTWLPKAVWYIFRQADVSRHCLKVYC